MSDWRVRFLYWLIHLGVLETYLYQSGLLTDIEVLGGFGWMFLAFTAFNPASVGGLLYFRNAQFAAFYLIIFVSILSAEGFTPLQPGDLEVYEPFVFAAFSAALFAYLPYLLPDRDYFDVDNFRFRLIFWLILFGSCTLYFNEFREPRRLDFHPVVYAAPILFACLIGVQNPSKCVGGLTYRPGSVARLALTLAAIMFVCFWVGLFPVDNMLDGLFMSLFFGGALSVLFYGRPKV